MSIDLQDFPFTPVQAISEIADFIADPVEGAHFPEHILCYRNDRAARQIGLGSLTDAQWVEHFGQFRRLPDAQPKPLALRYHGHQFRVYNPDIGDGRGFLFAQVRDHEGRLLDLGTKGSGQTPYSRFGDGRLTLKGAVREALATEMLEAQGVKTSRTISIIETGEALHRGDEPSPTRSAVLVRMSHGHIRIGSFQRLAALQDKASLERLVAYCLKYYYPEAQSGNAAAQFLALVTQKCAELAASYMTAGFVHGVLNTDNINISGESFDYGPWRWTPTFDPHFTAAYFDESGLYAFGRQAEAIHWNLAQLALSLAPLASEDALVASLKDYPDYFRDAVTHKLLGRLNVAQRSKSENETAAEALEQAVFSTGTPLDRFFFDWAQGARDGASYADPSFGVLREVLLPFKPARDPAQAYWRRRTPCSMLIEEVEAIWAPIHAHNDWSLFRKKISDIREMGEAMFFADERR